VSINARIQERHIYNKHSKYEADLDDELFMYPNIIQFLENYSLDLNIKLTLFPNASQCLKECYLKPVILNTYLLTYSMVQSPS